VSGEDIQPLANGRYKLEEPLGMGGMATVYRAMDGALQVERAIKLLSKDLISHQKLRTRFITEARTMARLRHPNVVTVFDVSVDEARPFIVMEMIEGGSLGDLIQKHGRLAVKLACDLVAGALQGVQAAHDQGVVHRDLKPDNILLTLEGIPKVTDFGIAHVDNLAMPLTRTGTVMGTLAYMSPEQRTSARDADARSDVFAMGATLYVAITGKEPFDIFATNVQDELLSGIPDAVAAVIRKACQYRPDDRFASATEMSDVLRTVSKELPEGLKADTQVGIDMRVQDSKETISLGDLIASDSLLTRELPLRASLDTPTSSPETPKTIRESSFLLDSPSIPEPPARSNRMVVLVLALGLGLGLAGGSIWLLKSMDAEKSIASSTQVEKLSPADPKAETQTDQVSSDAEISDVIPVQNSSEEPEPIDDMPDVPFQERDERVADTRSIKDKEPELLATSSGTASGGFGENSVGSGRVFDAKAEEGLAVVPATEPASRVVPIDAEAEEVAEAVVGGILFVNSKPQGSNVYVNGVFVKQVPLTEHPVHQAKITVKVVLESGESRQISLSFEGGDTHRVLCDFEKLEGCDLKAR